MRVMQNLVKNYFWVINSRTYRDYYSDQTYSATKELVLANREIVAQDNNVVLLTFTAADKADLPRWQPGCHLDFHLSSGRQRQYSLCGDPDNRGIYQVAVRKIPQGGGGSIEMHSLEIGASVSIRGPRNGFPFVGEGSALFIAGGIGITPILPMVRAAQKAGMDWHFIYAGRTKESMPFFEEISGWDSSRVSIHIDSEQGIISGADLLMAAPDGGAVYCCGPVPMLESIRAEFSHCAATALLYERFSAAPVVDGKEFEIQLKSTGEILTVSAETSVLEVIKKSQPGVAYSCQQGFCGTCRVGVLSGTPEHRENRLSPQEQENEMLICVSRSAGERLVIDL